MSSEIEWLEHNRHRVYPFRDADVAFAAPNAEYTPTSFFVDAYLTYSAEIEDALDDSWFIESLAIDDFTLVLGNSRTGETLALGVPAQLTDIGNYRSAVWYSTSAKLALTLLVRWSDHALSSTSGVTLTFDVDPLFAPRCIERQPKRVETVDISGGVNWLTTGEIGRLAEGTNIALAVDPDTALTRTIDLQRSTTRPAARRIMVTATPGAGTGRADTGACSESVDYIARINKVGGSRGQFVMDGDKCYRVGTEVDEASEIIPNTLQVDNDCEACCTCDTYVELLEQIRSLKDTGLEIKDALNFTVNTYNEIKALWAERVACLGDGCQTRVFAYSFTGWLLAIQVWVGNVENCENPGASLTVEFPDSFDPMYVPGSGMLYNTQDSYQQLDPTEAPAGTFAMSDNSGTPAGAYKIFVLAVRMRPTDARVDGANVAVTVTTTACGKDPQTAVANIALKGNTVKP